LIANAASSSEARMSDRRGASRSPTCLVLPAEIAGVLIPVLCRGGSTRYINLLSRNG
jgi:hypothetical protein